VTEEKAVRELRAFGLTENETAVYLFLVKMGSSSAGVIARNLGTNRMNVYRVLGTLQDRELVESTVARPSKFLALPITEFLNHGLEDLKTKASSLEKSKDEIIGYFEHLSRSERLVEEPRFRIVQGRKHIHDQISRMLDEVEFEVCLVQTRNGLFRLIYRGLDDKLKRLRTRGVKVKIITEIDASATEAVRHYLGFAQVRHISMPFTTRMVLVDEKEALTSFVRDDSGGLTTEKETAMWVRAPDYVKSLKLSFEGLWNEGVPAQQRLSTIATEQMFRDGLDSVRGRLEAKGWVVSVGGKLVGESGVEHAFDLVARLPDRENVCLVVDVLAERGSQQILAFNLKSMEVKPTVQLLAMNHQPNEGEVELAARFGAKLVYAENATQLEKSIMNEVNAVSVRRKNFHPKK